MASTLVDIVNTLLLYHQNLIKADNNRQRGVISLLRIEEHTPFWLIR